MTLQFLPSPPGATAAADARITRAADILDALLAHRASRSDPFGAVVPTGIPELDGPVGGLPLGTVTAVIGPPGSRSTWLLLRAALHAAARERPTLFCALDMALASFAIGLAHVVTARGAGGGPPGDAAVRTAAGELAELPLYVEVGTTISTHDIFAVAEGELIDFVVIDNVRLLLPSGSATDLKHCATDLSVAVLASTTHPVSHDGADLAALEPDLLASADTIASYDTTEQRCRVVTTRAWP